MSNVTPKAKPKQNHIDIIRDIEEFYEDNAIESWCPVTAETVKVRPLSVKQLKQFIELQLSAAKDESGILPNLDMATSLNSVIRDNVMHEDALSSLTVIDRDAIVVQLRASVKGTAELQRPNNETQIVNLTEIVENIKKSKAKKDILTGKKVFKYSAGSVVLNMTIPTIERDQFVNDYFRGKIKNKVNKGREQIKKDLETILSQLYFLELSKYVKNLTITKSDSETSLRFDDETLSQSLQLLEKLPSTVVTEITDFVTKIKNFRDETIFYTEDGKDVPLDIDANIFTGI
jgi:hypothetical protein